MVQHNPELEKIFVEECIKYNFDIINKPDYKPQSGPDSLGEFKLNIGDVVQVTNENSTFGKKRTILNPDKFKVIGQKGNIYELENLRSFERIYKPRFQIKK